MSESESSFLEGRIANIISGNLPFSVGDVSDIAHTVLNFITNYQGMTPERVRELCKSE